MEVSGFRVRSYAEQILIYRFLTAKDACRQFQTEKLRESSSKVSLTRLNTTFPSKEKIIYTLSAESDRVRSKSLPDVMQLSFDRKDAWIANFVQSCSLHQPRAGSREKRLVDMLIKILQLATN